MKHVSQGFDNADFFARRSSLGRMQNIEASKYYKANKYWCHICPVRSCWIFPAGKLLRLPYRNIDQVPTHQIVDVLFELTAQSSRTYLCRTAFSAAGHVKGTATAAVVKYARRKTFIIRFCK